MVNRLLIRSSWRFFTHHPWQLWLTLLSLALGTAVIIAVDLANLTANQSFRQSVTALSGEMTHEITARDDVIPDHFYTQLRVQWGYHDSAPLVEGSVSIAGIYYTLIGVDSFAYLNRSNTDVTIPSDIIPGLLTEPNGIIITADLAERTGVNKGEAIGVTINSQQTNLSVLAVLDSKQNKRPGNIILTDIATAQSLLDLTGGLSRIQLVLSESGAQDLARQLPDNLELVSYQAQQQGFSQMTEAFRINLSAMSLLAMLVGAFLVYNTMTFSVLQRRQTFAINRMIGTTGAQLFRHMLLEAVILGIAGSVLGIVLGIILGQGLLILVTQTISDLYVSVTATELLITPLQVIKGIGITLLAVLAATLAPALEAARVQPVFVYRSSHLEQTGQRMTKWLLLAGVICMIISVLLIFAFGRSLLLGFSGLFLFIMGYSLVVPSALKAVLRYLGRISLFHSLNQRMTIRGVQASLSRTSLAIVALTVAVSATVGVSIMIGSFRTSVADWLEATLQSDLYISARSDKSSRIESTLDKFWLDRVMALPGIASISTGHTARIDIDGIAIPLLVLQPGEQSARGFNFLHGDSAAIWQSFLHDEVVLVSEPFAYHRGVTVGDSLPVPTGKAGVIPVKIAGIFQDYSATQGMVVLPRRFYEQYWVDRSISSIGLFLHKDTNASELKQQLEGWAMHSKGPVIIRSNREVREFSLMVFDRTFAITNVLRLLVVIVAFIGVFSALMALFLEKRREFSILRATGFTPGRLRRLVLLESALIGLLAGILSLPLGVVMSEILIEVINQRSFGWTMQSHFFVGIPFQALLLAILAALLAGLYPTWRISQVSVREGLYTL